MNRFYFGGSDSSGSDVDDDALPYPKPLARSAFLTPDFDPTTFLSCLQNRHQTLEDLRTELLTRSQELNKELLDLVNENYQDFLSLGSSLRGGDRVVEEVRVGLLGFRRDVQSLKDKVEERKTEVAVLVEERGKVRKEVQTGRALLEIGQRLDELEKRLMVVSNGMKVGTSEDERNSGLDDSDEASDEEGLDNALSTSRLHRHVDQFLHIKRLMTRVPSDHPFLVRQQERVIRLRHTLLLDLSSALTQVVPVDDFDKERLLKIVSIYGDMGEGSEALRVLESRKGRG
ncbi:Conserved oligomeric Golgi complex, subunit 2, N-terminal [Lasallia pustulata]|uniref:Conserved oligomeric Golgi complex subunit 2 n=1 Tax=Lasallia pustulata TaxID=136370 RepID=A0A1W5CW89_9LECA|nr:Conserved oligomeric Golgi complex, subunit 2, N-terminal [Lasallia pustulata]